MMLFVLDYGSVAKIIGLIIFLLNAMSVSQAFFFFLRLICVSDRNGLPFSVVILVTEFLDEREGTARSRVRD